MSPTVFREGAARFYFFSREETRIHIHVLLPNGEAKFWLAPSISCANNNGLSEKEILQLTRIIENHKEEIIDAWNRHFAS